MKPRTPLDLNPRVFGALRVRLPQSRSEKARGELAELLALPEGERRRRVRGSKDGFDSAVLVHLLAEASLGEVRRDPAAAHDLAQIACEVACRMRPESEEGLYERAWAKACAVQGNALRVLDRRPEARKLFLQAREWVERSGDPSSMGAAEIYHFESVLRADLRDLDEALSLLERAIGIAEGKGPSKAVVSMLLSVSLIHYELDHFEEALGAVEQALALLDPSTGDPLLLMALHNRALYLCALERFEAASQAMEEASPLYDSSPQEWSQLRRRWLEGRIALGLGDREKAKMALAEVRKAFLRSNRSYDAAMVSLDLAGVHLEDGDSQEVRDLWGEIATFLDGQEVPRPLLDVSSSSRTRRLRRRWTRSRAEVSRSPQARSR